jgi:hypothetical protein
MVLLSVDFSNLHTILESLYNEMMPLCEDMLDVAKGLAGLGALFYVAVRVWQSLARAEPIDVYPLLRPFAIGICIMLFPTLVLGTMNTVLSPIVQGTHKMLEGQTMDMQQYREQKDRLERKIQLLDTIRPQYIILKPSLHGGIQGSKEWITLAQERGIGYWVTSALESNIGLNAIAQWCATLRPEMPQGLGTGMLFTDNIDYPLHIESDCLWFHPEEKTPDFPTYLQTI